LLIEGSASDRLLNAPFQCSRVASWPNFAAEEFERNFVLLLEDRIDYSRKFIDAIIDVHL
jgi:hypothetical protein